MQLLSIIVLIFLLNFHSNHLQPQWEMRSAIRFKHQWRSSSGHSETITFHNDGFHRFWQWCRERGSEMDPRVCVKIYVSSKIRKVANGNQANLWNTIFVVSSSWISVGRYVKFSWRNLVRLCAPYFPLLKIICYFSRGLIALYWLFQCNFDSICGFDDIL